MTSRRWSVVTYHNEDPREELKHAVTSGKLRLAVGQLERCPTTGRLHWQLYLELTSPRRKTGVQRIVGDSVAHCEACKGTQSENITYCTKDDTLDGEDTRFEYGERGQAGQGRRNDIGDALSIIRAGVTPETVHTLFEDHGPVMVKYHRGMQAALSHYLGRTDRGDPPLVFVHYGPTGSGKTHYVFDRHPVHDVWRAPISVSGSQWFDNYLGQPVALFDDFDGQHPAITVMLQVLDKYPLTVPVKGSHIAWLPSTIYITTNLPFEKWYADALPAHRAALKRRVTEFKEFAYVHHDPNSDMEEEALPELRPAPMIATTPLINRTWGTIDYRGIWTPSEEI